MQLVLIALPLETPSWGAAFSKFAMASYSKRSNFRVVYEVRIHAKATHSALYHSYRKPKLMAIRDGALWH